MTRHPMFRRCGVLSALFAIQFLRGQENSSWQDNFLQGTEAIRLGRYPEARRFLLAALENSNQLEATDLRSAETKAVLANLCDLQGDLKLAGPMYEESRPILEANGDAGKPFIAFVLDGLGELRLEQARWAEAETLLKQSHALHLALHGESDPLTMTVVRDLGELYACIRRDREAEDLLKQAIAVFRENDHPGALASTPATLGHLYVMQGHYALAESALKEAVALDTKLGDQHPALADALLNL